MSEIKKLVNIQIFMCSDPLDEYLGYQQKLGLILTQKKDQIVNLEMLFRASVEDTFNKWKVKE